MHATAGAVKLFHEGALALAQVERNGMRIDVDYLTKTSASVRKLIYNLKEELRNDKLTNELRRRFKSKVNPLSPEQIGWLAFDHLKYKAEGYTDTGKYKADKNAFEFVDHPYVRKYQKIKKLEKLRSTYLEGTLGEVVDGYVHPNFNLNNIVSYRSSSDRPNVQNQPVRDPDLAEYVRRMFIPRKGRRLVEVDMAGAEVRISACYNRDPVLINYIKDPSTDMHRDTASQLFSLPIDWLLANKDWAKKTVRDWSKNRFVFPQFYGSVYFQCAPNLWKGVCQSDVKVKLPDGTIGTIRDHLAGKGITELGRCAGGGKPAGGTFEQLVYNAERDMWYNRFKAYQSWKVRYWKEYQQRGELLTLTGFRIAGPLDRNDVLNYSVQGSAFHCLLWALIRLQKWLTKYRMKTKIICEIHDSILLDAVVSETADVLAKLKRLITVDLPRQWDWIIVPLAVEAEASEVDGNWYEKKGIDI